jgi:hypothetical protein
MRSLKDLRERGYVAIVERGGTTRNGRARSNAYEARFPPPRATVTPVPERDQCRDDTDPVPQRDPPRTTVTPEVVMEVSIEQRRSQATKAQGNGEGPNLEGARKARAMLRELECKMAEAIAEP